MPEFKKLSQEEIERIRARRGRKGPSKREQTRRQYREYLSQFSPGDWVEVTLKEGEKRLTVRNRLKRAAEELGYKLRFIRARGVIRFEVQEKE